MRIILVNLKLFYQRRMLWFFYVVLILFSFAFLIIPVSSLLPVGSVYIPSLIPIISFYIGMIVADLQKDVLTKPFSFLLPGYRHVPKFFIVGIGAALNLLMALRILKALNAESQQIYLTIFALYSLGISAYFLSVLLSLSHKMSGYSTAAFVVAPLTMSVPSFVYYATVTIPLVTILIGAASFAVLWHWLSRDYFARTYCGQVILGLGDAFNPAKMHKFYSKKAAEMLARKKVGGSSRFEQFTLRNIQKLPLRNPLRILLGNGYVIIGVHSFVWKKLFISSFLVCVLFGYFGGIGRNYLFVSSAFLFGRSGLHAHRTILLPRGRNEYLFNAAFTGLGLAFVVTILNTLFIGIMIEVSTFMPPFEFGESLFLYTPPDMRLLYFSPVLLFAAFAIGMLFPKKQDLPLIVLSMFGFWIASENEDHTSLLLSISSNGKWILLAASWLFFMLIATRYCRNQDLIE